VPDAAEDTPVRSSPEGRRKPWLALTLFLLCLPLARPGVAEVVELRLPSGRVATADYRAGLAGRPAVLLLHGLLQTREFPTVSRLADSLAESGYTVLAPTLSLDIDRRAQSLACEALHTHSLDAEIGELSAWLDWLAAATPAPIVVAGHSAGALEVLAQASERPHPRVRALVLISLTYFGSGLAAKEGPEHRRQAELDLAAGVQAPQDYALSYCARYPTLPAAFLSYVRWDRGRSLAAVSGLNDLGIHLILGGNDRRIDWDWIGELQAAGARLHRVPGANHFFDATDELDLLDAVESSLLDLGPAPRP
jgi:dienelactone hydrolase